MQQDRTISMEEFKTGNPGPDLVKMRKSLDDFRLMADMIKENWRITASITKAKYDALVNEGFTPQQALELCKGNM